MLFGEPRASEAACAIDGCNLVAPRLLRFEIVSVALKKRRDDPAVQSGLACYAGMAIAEREVPLRPLLDLARQTGLSVYDASYLWLLRRENLRLVTFDEQLAAAA